MSFIKINGVEFPSPAHGVRYIGTQLVDSARNANGVVISQKINRRQFKLDSLSWKYLKADVWENMLTEINKFDGELEFYSPHHKSFIKLQVYWGDDTSQALFLDDTGKPTAYVSCSCNVIDKGEEFEYT